MTPHLFVYGSLLSRAGHAMGARLQREARLLGEASLPGRLYKVSWYPALVWDEGAATRVHGEVYTLDKPAEALAWLDAYEGIGRADGRPEEYERGECVARLASGEDITAWVYLYRASVDGLATISDGRWPAKG
jgi:gamma-glutamylcyclotransferase (GGCT)/AIG2-like uncharacterized protein YtfP